MSRVGLKPIEIPDKVRAVVNDNVLKVEGPLGKNEVTLHPFIGVTTEGKIIKVARNKETRAAREVHGLMRALIQNAVSGVTKGFEKRLDIEGVGYRAEVKGPILNMSLGFSHSIEMPIPPGIKVVVEKLTKMIITGCDKRLVGQFAAEVRGFKPPEPYKGKGIRYEGEHIERKVGKAAATAGGGGGK